MTLSKKAYFIALGGINEKNYKMIKLLRTMVCLYQLGKKKRPKKT